MINSFFRHRFLDWRLPVLAVSLGLGLASSLPALAAAPTVSAITPTAVTANVNVTLSTTYSDAATVTGCNLWESGEINRGAMILNGGMATFNITLTAGTHSFQAKCTNVVNDMPATGSGPSTTVTATSDTTAPTVGAISPTSASEGMTTLFSTTYSDDSGTVSSCNLWENNELNRGSMLLNNGSATIWLALSAGSHNLRARCLDAVGNSGSGTQTTVTVTPPDAISPTVGEISQTVATVGVSTTLTATYSDNVGVVWCHLIINGQDVGAMNLSNGVASMNYTFAAAGVQSAYAMCRDAANNSGAAGVQSINVGTTGDLSAPSVGQIQSGASVGTTVNLSAAYSDNVGVISCNLYVNTLDVASMTLNGGVANASWNFGSAGSYGVYARCRDNAGNIGIGATATVVVNGTVGPDTTPPIVNQVNQAVATEGVSILLTANVSDNVGVSSCDLLVNGQAVGSMSVSGGVASRSYAFSRGTYTVAASCRDAANNQTSSLGKAMTVVAQGSLMPGSLIKTACPDGAYVSHPCRAVYYYGNDGKRHAFPNEHVYYTWYVDFSSVVEVSDAVMASFPLGQNVTYRPGVRMVKFTTVPKVYVVGRHGTLRWITSESLATSLYGSSWNLRIDDLSDALYSNYLFGADVNTSADFNPAAETAAATSIDLNY